MNLIYYITSAADFEKAKQVGSIAPQSLATEGFIHCSFVHQVAAVANRRFGGRSDLVVLEIDRGKLDCAVVDENTSGGSDLYPHIYGSLALAAVVGCLNFPCQQDGTFKFPHV